MRLFGPLLSCALAVAAVTSTHAQNSGLGGQITRSDDFQLVQPNTDIFVAPGGLQPSPGIDLSGIDLGALLQSVGGATATPDAKTQLREAQIAERFNPLAVTAWQPGLGVAEYAAQCAQVLGAAMPDFNCVTDGVPIPIYSDEDNTTDVANLTECANPSLLGGDEGCAQNARIGRIQTPNPDVQIVFICRKYRHEPRDLYQDIAVIHHNNKTGGTCWYQSGHGSGLSMRPEVSSPLLGRNVRPVNAPNPAQGESFVEWYDPDDMPRCTQCHQADPFIRTPYVNKVQQHGKAVVPHFPVGQLEKPYWHYRLESWNEDLKQVTFDNLAAPGAACTTCHRIGSTKVRATGTRRACQLIGEAAGSPTGYNQANMDRTPNHAWMHGNGTPTFRRTPPHSATSSALAQLQTCCQGDVPGLCSLTDIPGREAPGVNIETPVAGQDGIKFLKGGINQLRAYLDNLDTDNSVTWKLREPGQSEVALGETADGQTLLWSPPCGQVGDQLTVVATATDAGGQPLGHAGTLISQSITGECIGASGELLIEGGRKLVTFPTPELTGSLTQNDVLHTGYGPPLVVGDNDADAPIRSVLTFTPGWPARASRVLSAELVLIMDETAGRVLADPQAITAFPYRFAPPLGAEDFVGGQFGPHPAPLDASWPDDHPNAADAASRKTILKVDVTDMVRDAFARRDEQDGGQLSMMLIARGGIQGNGRADQVAISNRLRAHPNGLDDLHNILRPNLVITMN